VWAHRNRIRVGRDPRGSLNLTPGFTQHHPKSDHVSESSVQTLLDLQHLGHACCPGQPVPCLLSSGEEHASALEGCVASPKVSVGQETLSLTLRQLSQLTGVNRGLLPLNPPNWGHPSEKQAVFWERERLRRHWQQQRAAEATVGVPAVPPPIRASQ